jgi:hypothetical protein
MHLESDLFHVFGVPSDERQHWRSDVRLSSRVAKVCFLLIGASMSNPLSSGTIFHFLLFLRHDMLTILVYTCEGSEILLDEGRWKAQA